MADGALGYALAHGYRLPVALEKQTRIVAAVYGRHGLAGAGPRLVEIRIQHVGGVG
jgi:hypothetical protein